MGQRGLPEAFARQIYQQILGFGEYGFPESHSASFSLLVYVSAWLKHYEPAAFCAALINAQPMGFYAPAQLVQDARRHDVDIRNVDVTVSAWDCTLEKKGAAAKMGSGSNLKMGSGSNFPMTKYQLAALPQENSNLTPFLNSNLTPFLNSSLTPFLNSSLTPLSPSLRLGLRLVAGLRADSAARIVAARHARPFTDVADLAHRAQLDRRDLTALAAAGALAVLAGHRHAAVWAVAGVEKLPPLLAGATFTETAPALDAPTEGQDIVADYRALGLTLGRHPLALLRTQLAARRMLTATEILRTPHGRIARAAGIVVGRQRPDTASGVVFVTLEDETGSTNVIVWRDLSDRQRRELLGARLLGVYGRVEREGDVVHLIAGRLVDLSPLLGALPTHSRDFH